MRIIKTTSILLVGLIVMSLGLISYAQPNIPKENIPSDINGDVKKEIELLYSIDALERAGAASNLGKRGEDAEAAVPFLINNLV